ALRVQRHRTPGCECRASSEFFCDVSGGMADGALSGLSTHDDCQRTRHAVVTCRLSHQRRMVGAVGRARTKGLPMTEITDDERAQGEADAAALNADLQRRIWDIINDPNTRLALVPHVVARALAGVLTNVLIACVRIGGPTDLHFGINLIE